MKELYYTGQFKKDFKRLKNQPERAAKIIKVLECLQIVHYFVTKAIPTPLGSE